MPGNFYEHIHNLKEKGYTDLGWSCDGIKLPENSKFTSIYTAKNGLTIFIDSTNLLYYCLDLI